MARLLSLVGDVGLPLWRPGERKTVYLGALLLAASLSFLCACFLLRWQDYQHALTGQIVAYGDFIAFWSYAAIIKQFPAGVLYDSGQLHYLQVLVGLEPLSWAPFPYPPLVIPLMKGFDALPCGPSYLAWETGTLLLFLFVTVMGGIRSGWSLLAVILAPFSVLNFVTGQTGFFAAALIVSALRFQPKHPILSGITLGMLAYKPQVVVLLPIGFVAAEAWLTLLSSAMTVIVLVLTSGLLYGWDLWFAWIHMLPHYQSDFITRPDIWRSQPTFIAAAHGIGVPDSIGHIVQVIILLSGFAAAWRLCAVAGLKRATPFLVVGSFVVTPHAYFYDMPTVVVAVVIFVESQLSNQGGASTIAVGLIVAAMLAPVYLALHLLFAVPFFPTAWPSLALLSILMARTELRWARLTFLPRCIEAV